MKYGILEGGISPYAVRRPLTCHGRSRRQEKHLSELTQLTQTSTSRRTSPEMVPFQRRDLRSGLPYGPPVFCGIMLAIFTRVNILPFSLPFLLPYIPEKTRFAVQIIFTNLAPRSWLYYSESSLLRFRPLNLSSRVLEVVFDRINTRI